MRLRTEGAVYLIGVIVLGLAYYPLKNILPWPVFLVLGLTYLVLLRVLGRVIVKRMNRADDA